mmetsp:Transcript_29854/g.91631  ORF Transcript_29854/g.91631 Transcript_29854/m.91631 type:complete len:261 (+) Transcript_29854:2256-3038(+)
MIANVSPCSACCEHSLNTIRYAERVKDWQAVERQEAKVEAKNDERKPAAKEPNIAGSKELSTVVPTKTESRPQELARAPRTGSASRRPAPAGTPEAGVTMPHPASVRSKPPTPPGNSRAPADVAPTVAVPVTGGAGFSAINLDEDSEDEVLAHSLRFSAEQIEAHHAAKILLDAEEALLGAADEALKRDAEALAVQTRLLEAANRDGDMEVYTRGLRTALAEKEEEVRRLRAVLDEYEAKCVDEDAARRSVRVGVNLPWG